MRRVLVLGIAVATTLAAAASTTAGPITKQNGSAPVFSAFTAICAVPGYANYGACGGSTSTFAGVRGRIDAVQTKNGRYNLDFTFTGLVPGDAYRLWGNNGAFFQIGIATADDTGRVTYAFQTTAPVGLGFDLNRLGDDVTIATSYWSNQLLSQRPDGTLYVP